MAKKRYQDFKNIRNQRYEELVTFYRNKYFSMFVNAYKFPELTPEENRFIMTQFWETGTVLAFILADSKKPAYEKQIELHDEQDGKVILFTPYAASAFTIYNDVAVATPVALRGATFIPKVPMKVGKECVVGWGHSSRKPIRYFIEFYINILAEVQSAIDVNLFVNKMPRLITCSIEDRQKMEEIMNAVERGDKHIYLSTENWDAIRNVLDSGEYRCDKLYTLRQEYENELLTQLGINNIQIEKAERLVVDEANANNELIAYHSQCFIEPMTAFADSVTEVLDYPLTIEKVSNDLVNYKTGELMYGNDNEFENPDRGNRVPGGNV